MSIVNAEDIKGIENAIKDIEQKGIYCYVTKIELPDKFSSDLNRIAKALESISAKMSNKK